MIGRHFVLDVSALVSVGRGNIVLGQLVDRAHHAQGVYLYAPTCALVEADRARRGTAEHIAALSGVTIVDLGLPGALAVAAHTTWGYAHARFVALPSLDRPDGAYMATAEPELWATELLNIIDVRPPGRAR